MRRRRRRKKKKKKKKKKKGMRKVGAIVHLLHDAPRLGSMLGRPGRSLSIRFSQIQAARSCARFARCNIHGVSLAAWDTRQQKSKLRSPDFEPEESGEDLWLENCYKPARMDPQLPTVDGRKHHSAYAASPWTMLSTYTDQLLGSKFERLTPDSVKKLCQQGEIKGAVETLERLVGLNNGIDKYLLYSVLKECAVKDGLMLGCQLHALAVRNGLGSDAFLCNHFIRMYAGHGKLQEALDVFTGVTLPNVFMWCSIISAHVRQGQAERALELYQRMLATTTKPDGHVLVAVLQACAAAGDLRLGKQVHNDLFTSGVRHDMFVCNCLVDMYVKCGSLKDARRVFDGLGEKDVVTWTTMIAGYAQQEGMGQEALSLYSAMRNEGTAAPNAVTFMCLLQACASVGALQLGKQLHSEVRKRGFESDVLLGTTLVAMYAKCGRLELAREVFDRLLAKDLATWNALLKGYAEHGEAGMAIQCFEELLNQEIKPNNVTYICLFTACSHAGLIDQGQQYFKTMVEQHGIEPTDQLYCCMVDLLGRSGHLDKAELMLRASGLAGAPVSWRALLSACKSYGDAELGKRCFDHLVKLEPTDATAYLLMCSIYANAGKWDDVDKVERFRKAAGAKKVAAKACIEVKKEVLEFMVGGDRSGVATTLRKINTRVKEGGHVPQTQLVLRAVSKQQKEDALCGHAEKLALAYGVLKTPAGSPLVVTKNLRMCSDCHSSTKILSCLEKREIVVRDGHKVHRFQNGVCSCKDRL